MQRMRGSLPVSHGKRYRSLFSGRRPTKPQGRCRRFKVAHFSARSNMDSFACEECREISRELRNAGKAARLNSTSQNPRDLTEWLAQLDETECARIRDASPLWKAWRRWQEHRTRTGHASSVLPLPPGASSNPN